MGFRDRVRQQLSQALGISSPSDKPGFMQRLRDTVQTLVPGKMDLGIGDYGPDFEPAPPKPGDLVTDPARAQEGIHDIRVYQNPTPDVSEVVIRRAGKLRRKLLLTYNSDTRHVEPYRLVQTESNATILKALCGLHGKVESFRLDRIQAIGMTDEGFVEPTPYYLG